jgi:signal peptide peptidase SppA
MLADADRLQQWFAEKAQLGIQANPAKRRYCVEGNALEMQMMSAGYVTAQNGVALVAISGPMFKNYGEFGVADQAWIRAGINQAVYDPNVKAILLVVDSPGGSVAGTEDLANAIKAADAVKPVYAYVEDLAASAAYWAATGARAIYANNGGALVGSIGVITALVDASKYYADMGILVHPIVTGKFKGVGDPSQPLTQEHIDYVQARIDEIFVRFAGAVSKSRGIRVEKVKAMEAKVFSADEAVENKLIDGIATFEKVFAMLSKEVPKSGTAARTRAEMSLMEMEN